MTASEAILWSAIRSSVVCLTSLLPAMQLYGRIQQSRSEWHRRLWITAAVLPFFVPELLVGFTYRVVAARLIHSATATELLYGSILMCRAISVAVMALLIMPRSAIQRESIYSWTLLRPACDQSLLLRAQWFLTLMRLKISGPWRPLVIAGCISCLVSFQEFETAALMQVDRHPVAWTVWLFDAHAAHQPLRRSLMLTFAPLLLQLTVLIPIITLWSPRGLTTNDTGHCTPRSADTNTAKAAISGPLQKALPIGWLLLSLPLFVVWPIVSNARPFLAGLSLLTKPSALLMQSLQQITISLAFAGSAAFVSLRIGAALQTHLFSRPALLLLLMPGLMGSLVTALVLLAVFQWPVFRLAYDTWLPLLLGSALAALPRAFLLSSLLHEAFDPAAWHSTSMLLQTSTVNVRESAGRIRWRMRYFAWTSAFTVLCHWCFWDVTTTSILHPVQLDPVVTRLYNEMHYGRVEALLLISVLAAIAPWLVGAGLLVLTRLLSIGMKSKVLG